MKQIDVAVAVVFSESRVLIARRKPEGRFGGYWEFPGGKCEPGETAEQCVRRELREELAIHVSPIVTFTPLVHQYVDLQVRLHPFLCSHDSGTPELIACEEIRWVVPAELRNYQFPEANGPLIEQVIQSLPASPRKLRTDSPPPSLRASQMNAFT